MESNDNYNVLTYEKLKKILEDLFYNSSPLKLSKAYGYRDGRLVPIEETEAFDKAMKEEVSRMILEQQPATQEEMINAWGELSDADMWYSNFKQPARKITEEEILTRVLEIRRRKQNGTP